MGANENNRREIPGKIQEEIARFEEEANRYLQQVIGDQEFTPIQRLHGIYGQKQPGVQMVRVKIPSGILSAEQVAVLADIAEQSATKKVGHITTRQNVQLYGIKLEAVPGIMKSLASVGLTTREACGNTVRNVKCCTFAGLDSNAPFDPTPYALATTESFLRRDEVIAVREGNEKKFYQLPRKFKITFGGCCKGEDCGQAAINDVGFIATTKVVEGKTLLGFEMRVGGGLAAQPREATVLNEFVPAAEVLDWVEAVLRVFAQYGNYDPTSKGRAHSRLKYLIWDKSWEWFKEEVYKTHQNTPKNPPISPGQPENSHRGAPVYTQGPNAVWKDTAEYRKWYRINTRVQRQAGFRACTVTVPLGDLMAEQWRAIGLVSVRFGDGTIRLTDNQNVLLRWVREENIPHLYGALVQAGLAGAKAGLIGDVTSCPGADTCRLGITSSKGLNRELRAFLDGDGEDMANDPDLGQIHIKISGCPNSCGQHQLATIGFHGGAQSIVVEGQKKQIPAAMMLLGGGLTRQGAVFGRKMLVLPARKVKKALPLLAELYRETRQEGETFELWARRIDKAEVVKKLEPLTGKDPNDPELFKDADSEESFSFEVK